MEIRYVTSGDMPATGRAIDEDYRPSQGGPDTYGDRKLNLETGLAEREASETVIDEIGERLWNWH